MDASTTKQGAGEAQSNPPPHRYKRTAADLPGPKPLPILGNSHQIHSAQFHLVLENWTREFGSFYKFRIGGREMLVTSDIAVIGTLLRDRPEDFRRSERSAAAINELGTSGVFTAEGTEWRKQRKLVMRALTPEVIRNFFPTLAGMTERLRQRWQAAVEAERPVDVLRDLKAYTLDVTIGLAMGQDINALEHDDNPLQRDIELVFRRIARRLTSPVPYWRYFKLGPDRAADASAARIGQAVTGFIAQTRQHLERQPALRAKPSNMLEALVAARDEPGSEFSDAHVIGNAVTMVFAGEDTTSNTLAWLLNFVAREPQVAQRLATEADTVLGPNRVLQEYGTLEQLNYTVAATNEAMRLKPVAPFITVEANREMVVADTLIPKSATIFVNLRHAGGQADNFPEPQTFRPERWLSDPNATSNDDPARKIFPFGGGPRFCPGRYLAMAEIKMVMSMISRNFSLSLDTAAPPVKELFTFTMTPGSLPVRLAQRKNHLRHTVAPLPAHP